MIAEDRTLNGLMDLVHRIHKGEEKSVSLETVSKAIADYIIGKKTLGTEMLKHIAGTYEEDECDGCEDCDGCDEDEDPMDGPLADELQSTWMNDPELTLKVMAQVLAGVAGVHGLKDLSMVAHGIWLDT